MNFPCLRFSWINSIQKTSRFMWFLPLHDKAPRPTIPPPSPSLRHPFRPSRKQHGSTLRQAPFQWLLDSLFLRWLNLFLTVYLSWTNLKSCWISEILSYIETLLVTPIIHYLLNSSNPSKSHPMLQMHNSSHAIADSDMEGGRQNMHSRIALGDWNPA